MGGQIPDDERTRTPSDDELLTAARAGEASALETLLARYQPHLYRFGLRMCGNEQDAGDVAQESLMSMARSLRDFRGDSSVSTWLYTIARRFCMKKRRRSKFAPAREESLDLFDSTGTRLVDPSPNPEQIATNHELATALTRAIHTLPPAQREVLVLRDVEGLPAPDVAKVLGITIEAVKSRLHRARTAVREELTPILGGPAIANDRQRPCPDVLALFSRHLEGELDRTACAKIEAHLAECVHCRRTCESLKRTVALCRQLPTPMVPPSLASSIRTALQVFLDEEREASRRHSCPPDHWS
jgi:RNA polymerase sigma-70 factor (ECF subfamily)